MLNLEIENIDLLKSVCHALSTELRLNIIKLLQAEKLSCLELSKQLGYPLSTISANVKILEAAQLILTETIPAKNGYQKICSIVYSDIHIYFAEYLKRRPSESIYEIVVPIGSYMDCHVFPTCGFVSKSAGVSKTDDAAEFFHPLRLEAELIWFRKGWLEYKIPLNAEAKSNPKELRFSMELCSEAPGYNMEWKSDITVWINGVEVGTWTSPSDFGGQRGNYTPDYWPVQNTQYGILTQWSVNEFETSVNYETISSVAIADLHLEKARYITLRIGIKEDAKHIGGLNLFGRHFGNYPQAISLQALYSN